MFLALLEGHLFSNGITLISHLHLWISMSIYGRSWVLVGVGRF